MPDDVTGDPRRAFQFLDLNDRGDKPRETGVTEIRGPYYSVMGPNYLEDVLSTMGHYVDSLKFAGGSFSLMPEEEVQALLDRAHDHDVLVSTGGFMEYVLTQGEDAVHQYINECARLGFDVIAISAGFITLPTDDWLRLIEAVQEAGLKAKPEVGIQHGSCWPICSSSSVVVAPPPAPCWMPTSGLAFSPASCTASMRRSQSSVGRVMKPAEISMMSKPRRAHSSMYWCTASSPCVSTYSMNPPVETSTSWSWARSSRDCTSSSGIRLKEPPANLRLST